MLRPCVGQSNLGAAWRADPVPVRIPCYLLIEYVMYFLVKVRSDKVDELLTLRRHYHAS